MRMWLDRLTTHIPPSEITGIIDLGFGTGRFSGALAKGFSAHVLGIDPSEKMLSQVRRKAVPENVAFVQGSGEVLEVPAGSVDLIFLSMVFHHLPNPKQTVAEAFRVLRPGGFVAVRNGTRDQAASYPYHPFFRGFAALAKRHLPSSLDIEASFSQAGFQEMAHEVVLTAVAPNWASFVQKTALKANSLIARLRATDFEDGMIALQAHAAVTDPAQPVTEKVDLLVFRKGQCVDLRAGAESGSCRRR